MNLKEKIENMQKELNEKIHHLNSGGCIHFAFYFSKQLEELNIPHKIFFGDRDRINITKDYFDTVNHVMVYISKLGYVDGYTTIKYAKLEYRKTKLMKIDLSPKEIRFHWDWSPLYDTTQNILLQSIIKKHINDN